MRYTALRTLALTLGAATFAACGLLDTEQPNLIDPGTLDSPAGAAALRDGALADFAFAKDGDGNQEEDGLILVGGLLADEFMHSTTPPSQQEIDQRTPSRDNGSVSVPYTNLHQARAAAERAITALEQFALDPDETPDVAEMLAIAGYSYILFAEHYCSGVPFGRAIGDSLDFGQPHTTAEMFDTALVRFDQALAHPGLVGDDGTITGLAMVGRGRALVGLGRFAEAAAAVQAVPTDFVYSTEHADSPLRLQNAIWSYTTQGLWSVADGEGGAGLPYRSAQDARVQVDSTIDEETGEIATGLDLITPQYSLLKYASDSDIPLADGVEARLIEAEAALQTSDFGGMATLLNDPRGAIGLDPLDPPATQAEAIDLLFSERAFWLFATGHRLGDMRRMVRPLPTGYALPVDEVFPTGGYHKLGNYGGDVNFPLPIGEENRPEETGGSDCIDRNP
jgi:starch-binding outer membrane protein, SusD/RagB family